MGKGSCLPEDHRQFLSVTASSRIKSIKPSKDIMTRRSSWRQTSFLLGGIGLLFGIAIRTGQPDASAIPEFFRPYRPPLIALINGLGSYLVESGVLRLSRIERLLEQGCKNAELPQGVACVLDHMDDAPDYDPKRWREGLSVLTNSLQNEANLTALGILIVNEILKRFISNRARSIYQWKELGGIQALEKQVIQQPIIILGLPRTGSTFLHNLLSQDPELRAPLHWEYIEPIPSHDRFLEDGTHIARNQQNLDMFYKLAPGMHSMHPIDADMGEECIVVLGTEYTSVMFQAALQIPSYWRWLASLPSHRHAIRWQHRTLEYLQHRDTTQQQAQGSKPSSPRQWVLKAPWFMWMFDEIVAEYPDARIVWTHRAPPSTIASLASLYTKHLGTFSDDINLHRIGQNELRIGEEWLYRGMTFRDEWHQEDPSSLNRIVDIHLSDLKANPISVMEVLYPKLLGRELSSVARQRMQAFLDARKFRHGHHKANLTDFGLTRDIVMDRPIFRDYCARYNVTNC